MSGGGTSGSRDPRAPRVVTLPDAGRPPVPVVPGLEYVGELGRGPTSVVLHVRRGDVDYALKVLDAEPDPRAADEALAAFRRSAARLAMVGRPGLPLVREVGIVDGHRYLVTDLLPGLTLADLLAEGPLAPDLVQGLAVDLAGVLAAVHRHGLAHGSVTARNVVVDPTGTARLIDFRLDAEPHRAAATAQADLRALDLLLGECLGGRSRPAAPVPAGDPLDATDLALCGRDAELALLAHRWREARQGCGGAALITGPAGSGKSRLARELAGAARAGHAVVLRDLPPSDESAERLVERARTAGALLLHLDDVHRLDTHGHRRLAALAPHLRGAPLLLLATARSGAEHADAVSAVRSALGSAALGSAALGSAALGSVIEPEIALTPLDADGLLELVGTALPGAGGRASVPTAAARRLVERLAVRGTSYPRQVLDYLRGAADAGLLRPGYAGWELDEPGLQAWDGVTPVPGTR